MFKKLALPSLLAVLFFFLTTPYASAQTLSLEKPQDPVGYGQHIVVKVKGIPKALNTFTVSFTDSSSGINIGEKLTFSTTANGNTCSTRTTGSLIWQIPDPACKGEDGQITFTSTLRTAYLPKISSNSYSLTIANADGSISLTDTFAVTGSDLTLHVRPEGSIIDGEPIYSNYPATTSIGFCPDNKAVFQWWKSPNSGAYKTIQGCSGEKCPNNEDVEDNDNWNFTHKFSAGDKKTSYVMRAYCKSNNASVILPFDVLPVNKNISIEVPTAIAPLTAFDITVVGLENDKCYFIILKNASGDEFWPTDDADPRIIDCEGVSRGRHDYLPYLQFRSNNVKQVIPIDLSYNKTEGGNSVLNTGLPEGNYTIELWWPPSAGRDEGIGSMNESDKLAQRSFCVKANCSNTNGYVKPAPVDPPCKKEIGDDGCQEVYSAFGNFKTDPQGFLTRLFSILLSLSGGIALLFIIRSGYQLMTSQGDPEKVKEARERITSAIVGLLFIVFSLVILEVIGVDILAIPGLHR